MKFKFQPGHLQVKSDIAGSLPAARNSVTLAEDAFLMTNFMIDKWHFSSVEHPANAIEQGHVWEAYGNAAEEKIPTFHESSNHYYVHKCKSLTLGCALVFSCCRVWK